MVPTYLLGIIRLDLAPLQGKAKTGILPQPFTALELIKKGALMLPMLMVQSLQKSSDVQRPLSCVTGCVTIKKSEGLIQKAAATTGVWGRMGGHGDHDSSPMFISIQIFNRSHMLFFFSQSSWDNQQRHFLHVCIFPVKISWFSHQAAIIETVIEGFMRIVFKFHSHFLQILSFLG